MCRKEYRRSACKQFTKVNQFFSLTNVDTVSVAVTEVKRTLHIQTLKMVERKLLERFLSTSCVMCVKKKKCLRFFKFFPFKVITKKYILGLYLGKKSFSKGIMFHCLISLIFTCFNKELCFSTKRYIPISFLKYKWLNCLFKKHRYGMVRKNCGSNVFEW